MPKISGAFGAHGLFYSYLGASGAFYAGQGTFQRGMYVDNTNDGGIIGFDSSLVFSRIANEVRGASISVAAYISY